MSVETGKVEHHDPSEGFDRTEPKAAPIWAFTIASVLALVLVIWALQQYFEKIWNDAVYSKILSAPSTELQTVRGRDDWDLTHAMYLDKKAGQVRIPLDRARELFMKEVAEGKPFYPGKPTVPKKEEPDATAAQPGAATAQPGALPGQPGAAPAQPGAPPAQPGAAPTQEKK